MQYSYDQSKRLVQVETHDGSSFQLQAEMVYDGTGNRLQAIAHADGTPITATYTLDPRGGLPLLVDNGINVIMILYGQAAIGEYAVQTAEWAYYLGDAQLSVRQLVDAAGVVTQAQTYGPYGVLLHQEGDGRGLFGYQGGQSAANGLWYFGSGYFDPNTGQFLSRDGNPLLPLAAAAMANPGGFLLGPVLFINWRRRKKGKGRVHPTTLLLFGVLLAVGISGCAPTPAPIPEVPTPTPTGAPISEPTVTVTRVSTPTSTATIVTITATPTATECPPDTPTPCSGAVFLQGVPLYSQMETQTVYIPKESPTPQPLNPSTACGPTALAMTLNFAGITESPNDIIIYGFENEYYSPWTPPYTSPADLVNIANHYATPNFGNVTNETDAQELLRGYLCQNKPIIIDVTTAMKRDGSLAAHFVVVVGIDENNKVTVHDPYDKGAGARVSQVDWTDLWWSWQNNDDASYNGTGFWLVVRPKPTTPTPTPTRVND